MSGKGLGGPDRGQRSEARDEGKNESEETPVISPREVGRPSLHAVR